MVLCQEDRQQKANVHCTIDYTKHSFRIFLGRDWKVYLCFFDSQNAVLRGLPQLARIQSSRKPRVSEIWGYKRWLAIYQNITLIQLFKQRCIRTAALGLLEFGWDSPSNPDKRRPWGCISSALIFATTCKNCIASVVRTPTTSLHPVPLCWQCWWLTSHSEIKTWTRQMNS